MSLYRDPGWHTPIQSQIRTRKSKQNQKCFLWDHSQKYPWYTALFALFQPQGLCQESKQQHGTCSYATQASQGDTFIFLPAAAETHHDGVDCLTSCVCARAFVCVSVCVQGKHSAHSGQLAMISQWAITFVPVMYENRNSFSVFSHILRCPHTHTHTHTEDLTPWECPSRPSQDDTPEQWCFPLVAMAWGIFSLTDSAHSPRHPPPLLSLLHQSLPLPLYQSISVKLDFSFSPNIVLNLFHSFWRKCQYTYC